MHVFESVCGLRPLLLDGPVQMATTSRAGLICLGDKSDSCTALDHCSVWELECPDTPAMSPTLLHPAPVGRPQADAILVS